MLPEEREYDPVSNNAEPQILAFPAQPEEADSAGNALVIPLPSPNPDYVFPWTIGGIPHPTANGYDIFPANVDPRVDINDKVGEIYGDDRDVLYVLHAANWMLPCRRYLIEQAAAGCPKAVELLARMQEEQEER